MKLHELKPKQQKKNKKRVGRGNSSGHGTYSGRGIKGQKSRSGRRKPRPGFEGGKMPLIRQIPKVRGMGYDSIHPKMQIVNVNDSDKKFKDQEIITPKKLQEKGLIDKIKPGVKILGDGELKKKLIIEDCKVSKGAKEKIEKAGGKIEAGNKEKEAGTDKQEVKDKKK